jgi:hypothetical protein
VLLDTGFAEAVCDATDEGPVFGKSLDEVSYASTDTRTAELLTSS